MRADMSRTRRWVGVVILGCVGIAAAGVMAQTPVHNESSSKTGSQSQIDSSSREDFTSVRPISLLVDQPNEPESVYAPPSPPSEEEGINQGAVHTDVSVGYFNRYIFRGIELSKLPRFNLSQSNPSENPPGQPRRQPAATDSIPVVVGSGPDASSVHRCLRQLRRFRPDFGLPGSAAILWPTGRSARWFSRAAITPISIPTATNLDSIPPKSGEKSRWMTRISWPAMRRCSLPTFTALMTTT